MKNDYSHLLIAGDGYISSLSAVIISRKQESVTYLKGNSFSLDPSYQSRLSGLEFHYLQSLGRVEGISSLRKISHFVLPCPFMFHLDHRSILLGQGINSNLQELSRKLGDHFSLNCEEVTFLSKRLPQYLDEVSARLVSSSHKDWSLKSFHDSRGVFDLLYRLAINLPESLMRSFCCLFDNFIPKKIDELYRVRIVIDLMTPYFLINNEKMDAQLLESLAAENIKVIHDTANGISLQANKLEGLSLCESDLTFYFEELLGVGSAGNHLDLQVRVQENKMIGVDFIFQAHELLYYPISRFELFTRESWLGSSIRSLEIQKFGNKTVATFKVSSDAVSNAEESFIEFLKEQLDDFLYRLGVEKLSKTLPYIVNRYDTYYIEKKPRAASRALGRDDSLRYALYNEKSANLPNTRFLGQYSSQPLGKVSLFHKILQYSVKS